MTRRLFVKGNVLTTSFYSEPTSTRTQVGLVARCLLGVRLIPPVLKSVGVRLPRRVIVDRADLRFCAAIGRGGVLCAAQGNRPEAAAGAHGERPWKEIMAVFTCSTGLKFRVRRLVLQLCCSYRASGAG